MRHLLLLVVLLVSFAAPARADDIATAGQGVTRVVAVVQMSDGETEATAGTGFAVTSHLIVTNYHVIRIYDEYAAGAADAVIGIVPSQGSRPYIARIRWTDPSHDLALLEIVDGSLLPLHIFSGTPSPSSPVTALGYPANVDNVTVGSLRDYVTPILYVRSSGDLGGTRSVSGVEVYIHTANIGRGNSGGPLVDRCGRVLGVNSAGAHVEQGDAAFAFAISNNELLTFLRNAGVSIESESGVCVTTEERQQQEQARINLAASQARDACGDRNRVARERFENDVRNEETEARRASDAKLFIALGVLVCAGLAVGGAGLMLSHKKKKPAIITGGAAGFLLVIAIVMFAIRDSGRERPQPVAAENCQAVADATIANMTVNAVATEMENAATAVTEVAK